MIRTLLIYLYCKCTQVSNIWIVGGVGGAFKININVSLSNVLQTTLDIPKV